MPHVLYYVYQGTKPVERRGLSRVPVDITTSRTTPPDAEYVGEVSSIEELLLFVGDYHWAEGFRYSLRNAEEVHPKVRTKLRQILYAKTNRRKNESVISPEALRRRRPRTYRTPLPSKYPKPKTSKKP